MISCEVLITADTSQRGKRMLTAMADNPPSDVRISVNEWYTGRHDWLMLFGVGAADRWPVYQRHRHSGRRAILFDLGYWDRENALRVSVDDQHPHRWIYRMPAIPSRGHPAELRDDYDANGPVLFAGMGQKSMRQLGRGWDEERITQLQAHRKDIVVRRKPDRKSHVGAGFSRIEDALRGCSLVVTHHSNVAIDGIVAGIPHDVADGAAAAMQPTRDVAKRRDFLDRLGCWQWKHTEARELWQFLLSVPNV
jgi:hypothetical protein